MLMIALELVPQINHYIAKTLRRDHRVFLSPKEMEQLGVCPWHCISHACGIVLIEVVLVLPSEKELTQERRVREALQSGVHITCVP